jgi:hypothetical protein
MTGNSTTAKTVNSPALPQWVTVSIWGAVGSVLYRETLRAKNAADAIAAVLTEQAEKLVEAGEPKGKVPRMSIIAALVGVPQAERPEEAKPDVGWSRGWTPKDVKREKVLL